MVTTKAAIDTAIILAGGKGERLRPFTQDRPKAMVEINSKPIIDYQLRMFKEVGIKTVVIACSYLKEVLINYCKKNSKKYGMEFLFSIEGLPLGRGGGIKQAMGMMPKGWSQVLVTNGDTICKLDLKKFVKQHLKTQAWVTMLASRGQVPFGIMKIGGSHQVKEFIERPPIDGVNGGYYMMSKDIYPFLPSVGDHETETFPQLVKKGKIFAFPYSGYWRPIDTVKDRNEAEKEIALFFN